MKLRITMVMATLALAAGLVLTMLGQASPASAANKHALTTTATTNTLDTALPPIKHVFIIVLENESASSTFPASNPPAPYLANTMVSEGAFLPNYYATGHVSLDNYIAMYSGQAPNTDTSSDCSTYSDFPADTNDGAPDYEQIGSGCVYPADIQDIASQLGTAGLTWKNYAEDMGNDASRDSTTTKTCGHPAIGASDGTNSQEAGDAYADRHDPAIYFHNIIDDTKLCNADDVNLDQLSTDLQSASTTPNYAFITPNLCHDGHDSTCMTSGESGGYPGINQFLSEWVPKITSSPAFTQQNGLLITLFDEAATSDASSCCSEQPGPTDPEPGLTGSGGGRVGAVLISPCIQPGTVSDVDYNHYSMLGSVENLFGLKHIGYANTSQSYFGNDIYTNPSCVPGSSPPPTTSTTSTSPPKTTATTATLAPPAVSITRGTLRSSAVRGTASVPLVFGKAQHGITYEVEARQLPDNKATAWTVLISKDTRASYTVKARSGATYQFRVRATNAAGKSSAWRTTATTVIPTYAKPAGAVLKGKWSYKSDNGAWRSRAEIGAKGATFTYAYTGGRLQILATKAVAGGLVRVTLDGKLSRVISVHAGRHEPKQTVFNTNAKLGRHTLRIQVLKGQLALEALVISYLK